MSETSICNSACVKLGAELIITRADGNNRARALNARFDQVRDAELRKHRWKFAIKRAALPALADAPLSDYDFQYQLPVDFLRLIEGGDITAVVDLSDCRNLGSNELYSIEGDRILTNLGAPLNIRYIARITDTALFDPAFEEAFASKLAFECCERITQSDSKKDSCRQDYKEAIRAAVRANALEQASRSQADAEWVVARRM
jgi:hypothetical protein